jgi:phosphohistidine phosphatase
VQLYIVRHAIAFDRDPERWPDDRDRPLTEKGERRFRRIARRLRRLGASVDSVWSSPLARAWRTAEILASEARWPAPTALKELEPGGAPADVVAALKPALSGDSVAVVGHEPGLHELISYLLAGSRAQALVDMRKGGIALLEVAEELRPGSAHLSWVLPPRVMLEL